MRFSEKEVNALRMQTFCNIARSRFEPVLPIPSRFQEQRQFRLETAESETIEERQVRELLFDYAHSYNAEYGGAKEYHDKLLELLQTRNCRKNVSITKSGSLLARTFVRSAQKNHSNLLQAWFENNINIDVQDEYGYTAFYEACLRNHEDVARTLLEKNANIDGQNNEGQTPLMSASWSGHINIVKLLLEKSANPDIQDKSGKSALIYASDRDRREIVRMLLDHGVDTELRENRGNRTAAEIATTDEIKELFANHVTSYIMK